MEHFLKLITGHLPLAYVCPIETKDVYEFRVSLLGLSLQSDVEPLEVHYFIHFELKSMEELRTVDGATRGVLHRHCDNDLHNLLVLVVITLEHHLAQLVHKQVNLRSLPEPLPTHFESDLIQLKFDANGTEGSPYEELGSLFLLEAH